MVRPGRAALSRERPKRYTRRAFGARIAIFAGLSLLTAACSGMPGADYFSFGAPPPPPAAQPSAVGAGQVKVALILPLSAQGNGAAVAQAMRNAAEMALAEFSNPDIQLLVKDDGGTSGGAQAAAQQALAEGAEIVLGPLFAVSVSSAAQVARARGVPVIAFSTDSTVAAAGMSQRRVQSVGTGVWDGPRVFAEPGVQGGWFAAPEPGGYRAFSGRYRSRYGQDPLRPATLAYDAVSLVAALVKTQGPARFAEETLTTPSGFAGIDGVFRFRPDGTNQRGLAVMRVTPQGGQVVSPAPKALGAGGT